MNDTACSWLNNYDHLTPLMNLAPQPIGAHVLWGGRYLWDALQDSFEALPLAHVVKRGRGGGGGGGGGGSYSSHSFTIVPTLYPFPPLYARRRNHSDFNPVGPGRTPSYRGSRGCGKMSTNIQQRRNRFLNASVAALHHWTTAFFAAGWSAIGGRRAWSRWRAYTWFLISLDSRWYWVLIIDIVGFAMILDPDYWYRWFHDDIVSWLLISLVSRWYWILIIDIVGFTMILVPDYWYR